jgi:hypothetical protein
MKLLMEHTYKASDIIDLYMRWIGMVSSVNCLLDQQDTLCKIPESF